MPKEIAKFLWEFDKSGQEIAIYIVKSQFEIANFLWVFAKIANYLVKTHLQNRWFYYGFLRISQKVMKKFQFQLAIFIR